MSTWYGGSIGFKSASILVAYVYDCRYDWWIVSHMSKFNTSQFVTDKLSFHSYSAKNSEWIKAAISGRGTELYRCQLTQKELYNSQPTWHTAMYPGPREPLLVRIFFKGCCHMKLITIMHMVGQSKMQWQHTTSLDQKEVHNSQPTWHTAMYPRIAIVSQDLLQGRLPYISDCDHAYSRTVKNAMAAYKLHAPKA
jgi:hypothetical protein